MLMREAYPRGGDQRLPAKRSVQSAASKQASVTIATLAEIVDRLDTFAVAEVDLIDSKNDVEEAGLTGYDLGIYLDILGCEDRLDPGEMFGAVYVLLVLLEDSGLYDVELVFDDEETNMHAMRELLTRIAEEAGYYVGPETELGEFSPLHEPQEQVPKLSAAERFFLDEAKLSWPCAEMQLKRQWKAIASRYHPDKAPEPAAADKFRRNKEGYELLKQRFA